MEIDIIESMENCAEQRYFDMEQGNGKLKCFCGNIFNEGEGEIVSPNPYSMPVCGECFEKFMKEQEDNGSTLDN